MIDSNQLSGWFAIATSHEIKEGEHLTLTLFNQAYTLSRHRHQQQLLLSPGLHHIIEQNGIIYKWQHPLHQMPSWSLPLLSEITWRNFLFHTLTVKTHPQEVYENCIDISHFNFVHDFQKIQLEKAPVFNAHHMCVHHKIDRKHPLKRKMISAHFEVQLYGLGCAYTHITVPTMQLNVRMFALTTPIQTGQVRIILAVAIPKMTNPFKNLCYSLLHRNIKRNIVHDFIQDVSIWENKCYKPKPLLVKGDGEILKFRQWASQFYITEGTHE